MLRLAVVLIIGGIFMLRYIENQMVFPGATMREVPSLPKLPEGAEVWKNHDGVEAVYIPSEKVRGLLFYAHGNGELIDDWLWMLSPYYRDLGLAVVLVEYRGYGRSKGQPTEEKIVEDFAGFYDRAMGIVASSELIVFHGRSLGGGVVTHLSSLRKATHLVLESTFSSLSERAWEMLKVPSVLIRNKFDSVEHLQKFKGKTLIIHGKQDVVIPFHHALKLREATHHLSGFVELQAGHNDVPFHEPEYWLPIETFLK